MARRRIAQQTAFLKLLHMCPARQRKALIQYVTDEQLEVLFQIAFNILQRNVPMNDVHKKKMKRYRVVIRSLCNLRVSKARKRQSLLRFDSLIPYLIKPVLHLLDES